MNGVLNGQRFPVAVLVADDDADFRALIQAYLSPEEFAVTEASDGKNALQNIEKSEFDLIVLDLVMPERDGLELIPAIRRRFQKARILAVSGAPGRSLYLKTARLMGANVTLEKPFSRESFCRCVHQLVSPQARGNRPENA